jgi:hypothetical protein
MHPLATKPPGISPLLGLLKIDQLAYLARNDQEEEQIKRLLRLQDADWVEDHVIAEGYVRGHGPKALNRAKLLFNYDLGVEVEILRYVEGANYPDVAGIQGGRLVHIGMHVEKGKELPDELTFVADIIQKVETQHHTNEFLVKTGRKYRYTIYDTLPLFGVFLKVIERLEPKP